MRPLAKVLGLLLAAIGLYVLAFACVLDRPLSLGLLRRALAAKIAYAAGRPDPKLVILAGSNALFSHSCAIIGGMLRLPCVNGGVALGLGSTTSSRSGSRCCTLETLSICQWNCSNMWCL